MLPPGPNRGLQGGHLRSQVIARPPGRVKLEAVVANGLCRAGILLIARALALLVLLPAGVLDVVLAEHLRLLITRRPLLIALHLADGALVRRRHLVDPVAPGGGIRLLHCLVINGQLRASDVGAVFLLLADALTWAVRVCSWHLGKGIICQSL